MELYTLNALLQRDQVIDVFDSCIWTERFQEKGDFELIINSTRESRSRLKTGTLLACNESFRVMEVQEFEDDINEDGEKILKVKGPSLEGILENRVAKNTLSGTTTEPKWVITDTPTDVARKIFHDICVTGTLNVGDKIPFIIEGTFMPASTIIEPDDIITTDLDPQTVYQAISDLAKVWNFGFRLLRLYDTSQLYFDIYMGSDRTTAQSILNPVIFTPELDNLQNTTELATTTNAKNVAYVFSPAGYQVVYSADVNPDVDGFERRVLVVNATDITDENPDPDAAMIQRGREELAKNKAVAAFDGEINPNSLYKYGRDYELGDIVEIRNADSVTSYMRVTEQIFVSDREGERAYPTLALNAFVNEGSWLSYGTTVWSELTTEHWGELP